eukprot:4643506-Pyramimonas_sp.AAC.1
MKPSPTCPSPLRPQPYTVESSATRNVQSALANTPDTPARTASSDTSWARRGVVQIRRPGVLGPH